MNRIVRQATIFLVLLLLVSLIRLPYGSYRERYLPRLKALAAKLNISPFDADDITLSFPFVIGVNELGMSVPAHGYPIPIFINSLNAKLSFLSLFTLRPNIYGTGELYSGTVTFEGARSFWGGASESKISFSNLKLEAHPTLAAFGAKGLLNIDVDGKLKEDFRTISSLESLRLKLSLRDGDFSGQVPLSIIKLPAITGIKLSAEAALKGDRLTLHQANLDSSAGTAQGSGSIILSQLGQAKSGTLDFQVQLNEQGRQTVGGYLALAAGTAVDKPAANWKVNLKIENGRARATIKPA